MQIHADPDLENWKDLKEIFETRNNVGIQHWPCLDKSLFQGKATVGAPKTVLFFVLFYQIVLSFSRMLRILFKAWKNFPDSDPDFSLKKKHFLHGL